MKDEYLNNLYLELELCNITIVNAHKFSPEVVAKAKRMKKETEERIKLRELIPIESRS